MSKSDCETQELSPSKNTSQNAICQSHNWKSRWALWKLFGQAEVRWLTSNLVQFGRNQVSDFWVMDLQKSPSHKMRIFIKKRGFSNFKKNCGKLRR